jgi:hypothetical protein
MSSWEPLGSGAALAPSLRERDSEVARLSALNFNLKMRIYYLEDRLAKGRAPGAAGDSEAALQARARSSGEGALLLVLWVWVLVVVVVVAVV